MATRYQQPQSGPFIPSAYWLSRGLQMVFDGQRVLWSRPSSSPSSVTKGGTPKAKVVPGGIATGFGATYGTGTSDRIDSGRLDSPRSGTRSVVARLFVNTTGGAGLGRVFQSTSGSGIANAGDEAVYLNSSGMLFARQTSTNSGASYTTTPAFPTGRWATYGFSFLGDYPTNTAPILLIDGVSVGVTTTAAAGAAFAANTSMNVSWGNRSSDTNARSFDGMIGVVLIFDGYLTPQEHAMLTANPWQVAQASSRYLFSVPDGSATATLGVTERGDTVSASASIPLSASFSAIEAQDTASAAIRKVNVSFLEIGAPSVIASLAVTEGGDTASSSATVSGGGSITATLAVLESNDTGSAAATVGVSASGAAKDANEAATSAAGVLLGATLAATESGDTAAASSGVLVSASATAIDSGDTVSASSSVASGVVASLATSEAGDTVFAAATIALAATGAAKDYSDTLTAPSTVTIAATGTGQDTAETLTSLASVGTVVSATLTTTDGKDTLTSAVAVSNAVLASLTGIDGADRATSSMAVTVDAAGSASEGNDRAVGVALMPITATCSVREAADGIAAQVAIFIAAQILAVESGDWVASGIYNGEEGLHDPNRTTTVGPEVRGVGIPVDGRLEAISAESRTTVVLSSSNTEILYS